MSLENHISSLLSAYHESNKDIPNVISSKAINASGGSYTAPSDGIVSVGANGNAGIFTVRHNEIQVHVSDPNAAWSRGWCFVRKGDEVRCLVGGETKDCDFYFCPL